MAKRGRPKKNLSTLVEYKATLINLGKKFESSGPTLKAAVSNLNVRNARGRGVLVLEGGGKRRERILSPIQVARIFGSHGIVKDIVLNQLLPETL